jgi:hypothetical protein
LSLIEKDFLNDLLEKEEYESITSISFDTPESAIRHYIRVGEKSGLSISSAFDANFYLAQVQERSDQNSILFPLVIDYYRRGEKAGYLPNKFFNPLYYRYKYPDLQNRDLNLLQHFVNYGLFEARNPNPFFPVSTFSELWSNLYPGYTPQYKSLTSLSSIENLEKLKCEFVTFAVSDLDEFLNSDLNLDLNCNGLYSRVTPSLN